MYDDYQKLNEGDEKFFAGEEEGENPDPWVSELSQQLYVNKEPTSRLRVYRQQIIDFFKIMDHANKKKMRYTQNTSANQTLDDMNKEIDSKCNVCSSTFEIGDVLVSLSW